MPSLSQFDLVTVAAKVPHAVIYLVSALFYHELTIQIPREVWIAIHRNSEPPRLDFPPIRVSRLADVAFKTGIEKHAVDGQTELLDSWLICFQMVSRDGSPSIANCLWGRDSNIL